jgi:MFS family permease
MAGALSTNLPMVLIVRFLAGTFGSAPLTNAGGQIGDMFAAYVNFTIPMSDNANQQTWARFGNYCKQKSSTSDRKGRLFQLFALAPFLGPVLGPIVGGFVVEKHGFRWVFWVQFIFAWYVTFFATQTKFCWYEV